MHWGEEECGHVGMATERAEALGQAHITEEIELNSDSDRKSKDLRQLKNKKFLLEEVKDRLQKEAR